MSGVHLSCVSVSLCLCLCLSLSLCLSLLLLTPPSFVSVLAAVSGASVASAAPLPAVRVAVLSDLSYDNLGSGGTVPHTQIVAMNAIANATNAIATLLPNVTVEVVVLHHSDSEALAVAAVMEATYVVGAAAAVLTTSSTAVAEAVANAAANEFLPVVGTAVTSPDLSDPELQYFARVSESRDGTGAVVANMLLELGWRDVWLLYTVSSDAATSGIVTAFRRRAAEIGVNVLPALFTSTTVASVVDVEESIESALESVIESQHRVVVLLGDEVDSFLVAVREGCVCVHILSACACALCL